MLVNLPPQTEADNSPRAVAVWESQDISESRGVYRHLFSVMESSRAEIRIPLGHPDSTSGSLQPETLKDCRVRHIEETYKKLRLKLQKLTDLSDDWDQEDSPAPDQQSVDLAMLALNALREMRFNPIAITPSSEGGIVISLGRQGRSAWLSIYNEGEISAAFGARGEQGRAWELPPTEEAIKKALLDLRAFAMQRSTQT